MNAEIKRRAEHDVAVAERDRYGDFGRRATLDEALEMLEDAGWTIIPPPEVQRES